MIIKKLKCLLFSIAILTLYTACEEERTPGIYELAPEMTVYEASVNGNTVTIRVDNLTPYLEAYYEGEYGLYFSETSDMNNPEVIDLKHNSSGTVFSCQYSLQDNILVIDGLEDNKTYYYCAYIKKINSSLRTETKSFTISRIGINSLEDLLAFRDAVNEERDLSAFVKNETVNLYVDIDMKSIGNWEPIKENRMKFNGNGHTIKNMHINTTENNGIYGFFAISGGEIVNLNIGEGCRISNSAGYSNVWCGGICGVSSNGAIRNCTNAASLEGTYVGGIVGSCGSINLEGNTNSGVINNSVYAGGIVGYADGNGIYFTNNVNTATLNATTSVGGIAGCVKSISAYPIVIDKNTNNGRLDCLNNAGGIVGEVYGANLIGNINNGIVTGTMKFTGGIAGMVDNIQFSSNINNGIVNGKEGRYVNDMGIAGIHSLEELIAYRDAVNTGASLVFYKDAWNRIVLFTDIDMSSIDNWIPIERIEKDEEFLGNGYTITNMTVKTESTCAGFIARNAGEISSLNIGEGCTISSKSSMSGGVCGECLGNASIVSCTNAAKISGKTCGGITGYAEATVTLERNNNSGDIEGSTAGGIIGIAGSSVVTGNENTGSVKANYMGGGIAGTVSEGTIKNNTNNGDVVILDANGSSQAGGVVGKVWPNSFVYDNINKGTVTGYIQTNSVSVDGIVAKSTATPTEAGGIAGRVEKSTLKRNANSGAVTGTSGSTGGVAGVVYAVSVLEDNTNTATVNGESPTADNEIGVTR